MPEIWVRSLCQEDPLEKERTTNFSVLAWKTPWIEKPGSPQGCKRVGQDLVTKQQTHVCRQGIYGKSVYLLVNFAVNLKLL